MSLGHSAPHERAQIGVGESLAHATARGDCWSADYHAAWLAGRPEGGDLAAVSPRAGLALSDALPEDLSIDAAELLKCLLRLGTEYGEGERASAPRGIDAEGLCIHGVLNFKGLDLQRPISLRNCVIEGGIIIEKAHLGPLDLSGSTFPFLSGDAVRIDGDLVLENLDATDWIDLREARIAGQLSLAGSSLNPEKRDLGPWNPDQPYWPRQDRVLHCESARIDSHVHLSYGFSAYGEVCFGGAFIGGTFDCRRSSFTNRAGTALQCTGAEIGGVVDLWNMKARGEVSFQVATIKGRLFCHGASFAADAGVTSRYGMTYAALNLNSTRIGESLVLTGHPSPVSGGLDLTGAETRKFSDDGTAWPEKGQLRLDGFVYETFYGAQTPLDHNRRRDWLERQSPADLGASFKPQPWTQCAKVLAAMGRNHEARLILHERERRWLESGQSHPVTRFFYRFVLGPLAGYGYKNHYALNWAVGVWLVGALVFGVSNQLDMMRPASEHVLIEEEYKHTGLPPKDYEPLNALFYSADLLLPIVDIGQERYWIPRNAGEKTPDAATALPRLARSVAKAVDWIFGGWLPKAYYYFEIAMGWLLVSIVIAGFSKVLGHPGEE
jgi:hypothetical protein